MRERNFKIFTDGDMSGHITGAAICIRRIQGWAAQFYWTGDSIGVASFEVSCDPSYNQNGTSFVPTNFTPYGGSSKTVADVTVKSDTWNVNLANYNWIRFIYTRTSGTGVLNGRINIKGLKND